ncbi:MAG: hypothetical protein JO264_06125 [Acidisphaera sp.]|nr:hypothetical protein [Acidisphaera sp.]
MAKHPQTDPAARPAREQEKKDPHGVGSPEHGAEEPTAGPDSDRQQTETAAQRPKPQRK